MSKDQMRLSGGGVLRFLGAAGTALFLLGATGAQATIKEIITIENNYGYSFGDSGGLDFINSGESSGSFRLPGGTADLPAELGLDFTGTVDGSSFSFLHNAYCVGRCLISSWTTVVITLENLGSDPEALRFDTLITPGHLARQGVHFSTFASFNFDVTQTTDGVSNLLFHTVGLANNSAVSLSYNDVPDGFEFNGVEHYDGGDAYEVLDWSATRLSLDLDVILPGQTSTLRYFSLTQVDTGYSECPTLVGCPGVQVAFGDPRNTGGGAQSLRALSRVAGGSLDEAADEPGIPIIGRQFDATQSYFDILPVGVASERQDPILLPRVNYDEGPFVPQAVAVPEPATWAMMIAGFGMTGAAMRRRRTMLAA